MNTHVTREQKDRLRDRTLSPREAAEIGRHAAGCAACRELVDAHAGRGLRDQFEAEDVEHPSPDTLMAYADGTLAGDELVTAHVEECEICAADVSEIREFKKLLRPRRRWIVYAIAASIAAAVVAVPLFDRRDEPAPPIPARTVAVTPHPPLVVPTPSTAHYRRSDWEQWVAEARQRRAFPIPAIVKEMRPKRSGLRGPRNDDVFALSPNHVVVADARPRLQWTRRAAATYKVILKVGRQIVESETLHESHWSPATDLQRGRDYEWQVEVNSANGRRVYPRPPEEPAQFHLLDQNAIDEIEAARREYPDDALLHAVILARHGLKDDALDALRPLSKTDDTLASALRESLRKWES